MTANKIRLHLATLRVESFATEPTPPPVGTIHAHRMEEGISEQTCSCAVTCIASCGARETCAGASCEITRCPVVHTCFIPLTDAVPA